MTAKTFAKAVVSLIVVSASAIAGYRILVGPPPPPIVESATAQVGDVTEAIQATGTLAASETVDVGSLVTGTVEKLSVDFNDLVHKGEVLATLDPARAKDALESAEGEKTKDESTLASDEATLVVEQHELSRIGALVEDQQMTKDDLDGAKATEAIDETRIAQDRAVLTSDDASIKQAQVNLDRCTIMSPIDGVIVSRDVNEGQTVNASVASPTIYELASNLRTVEIVGSVDEADVALVKAKQPVRFTVDAFPGRTFQGVVREVRLNASTVNNVVTYQTIVDATNSDLRLLPGMTARFYINVGQVNAVLRVPVAALQFRPTDVAKVAFPETSPVVGGTVAAPGTGRIWKVAGEKLVPISVRTGLTDGKWTEILSGDVAAGDTLITSITSTATKSGARNPFSMGPTRRG